MINVRPLFYAFVLVSLSPLVACLPQREKQITPAVSPTTRQVGQLLRGSREEATSENESAYPKSTAVLWGDGFLWTANESGLLTRWDVQTQDYAQYRLPGEPTIRALTSDGRMIYAGTEGGDIWRLTDDGMQSQLVDSEFGWISALALDDDQNLWYANTDHFGQADSPHHLGGGLVSLKLDRPGPYAYGVEKRVYSHLDGQHPEANPLQWITSLAHDPERSILWVGTRSAGLLGYNTREDSWQEYNTFNSDIDNNTINDVKVAPDGSLWLTTASGVSFYQSGVWGAHPLTDEPMAGGALSLAIADDHTVWVTSESYIAQVIPGETWQVYYVTDNPLLADRIRFVVVDDKDQPWFIGRRGKIHFNGDTWIAYDADVRRFAVFVPMQPLAKIAPVSLEFPSPTQDYTRWLKTWPRPEADNGLGIHFLQLHQYDAIEAQGQVNRMKRLGMRWSLVHYADHEQLVRIAPIFQEAGISVIWRPFVRPHGTYPSWVEDVEFLRSRGLAPYIQLYNEPSLAQEWDNGQPVDQERFMSNLLPAAQQVYNAGGYIGLQFVEPDWLRGTLRRMKAQGMRNEFDRLFFIPHLYGLNHPPEYDEDINGVLGFREFAKVFEEEIGFVPVMIAGEGGWRPGEAQDNRYPAISEALHRDFHLAVFDWFRTGRLSGGEALPDYLFAFCPWLISDPHDPAAWFDSDTGDRTLIIEAVEAIPPFRREFSWDK
jgi:sugar lactone lactonase YvrE